MQLTTYTPLCRAPQSNKPIVPRLLHHKANVREASLWGTPLVIACCCRNSEVAWQLLKAGASPSTERTHEGMSPLMAACQAGSRASAEAGFQWYWSEGNLGGLREVLFHEGHRRRRSCRVCSNSGLVYLRDWVSGKTMCHIAGASDNSQMRAWDDLNAARNSQVHDTFQSLPQSSVMR